MKSWRADVVNFGTMICCATNRAQAKFSVWSSAKEVGYKVKFSEISVKREKKYDLWAEKQTKRLVVDEQFACR